MHHLPQHQVKDTIRHLSAIVVVVWVVFFFLSCSWRVIKDCLVKQDELYKMR